MSSRLKVAGSIGVLLLAGAIVAWREVHRDPAAAAAPTAARTPQVVLFVDLGEAEEAGGCGAIIHEVREAARRGVATEEIDARDSGKRAERYGLLVAPALLILDESGHEARRFQGETPRTVEAIRDELARLTSRQ